MSRVLIVVSYALFSVGYGAGAFSTLSETSKDSSRAFLCLLIGAGWPLWLGIEASKWSLKSEE